MPIVISIAAGMLFGAGLAIAQMLDPRKILDFLDVAAIAKGGWDPTLLMVFIGALPIVFAAYAIQRKMIRPIVGPVFELPTRSDIDARLIGGSALFGIGWGLVGVCPGPAVAALALAGPQLGNVVVFVGAMLAGMVLSWLVGSGNAGSRMGSVQAV